jgi:hypothetical protein
MFHGLLRIMCIVLLDEILCRCLLSPFDTQCCLILRFLFHFFILMIYLLLRVDYWWFPLFFCWCFSVLISSVVLFNEVCVLVFGACVLPIVISSWLIDCSLLLIWSFICSSVSLIKLGHQYLVCICLQLLCPPDYFFLYQYEVIFFALQINFSLESASPDMSLTTPACFQVAFALKIFFPLSL